MLVIPSLEGRCKATWKGEFKLPLQEAGPPNYLNDEVDSDQQIVNKELSLVIPDGTIGGPWIQLQHTRVAVDLPDPKSSFAAVGLTNSVSSCTDRSSGASPPRPSTETSPHLHS